MAQFEAVDNDPFAAPTSEPRLEPVDYDPFAGKDVTKNPTEQVAAAKGVFPAVNSSGLAAVPSDTFPTQAPTGVRAPTPSTAPVSDGDPGILAESIGDTIKGAHSVKRGAYLTSFAVGAPVDIDELANTLASSKEIEAQYPTSTAVRKAQEEMETLKDTGAAGLLPAMGVYVRNPRAALSTTLQSVPSMAASIATICPFFFADSP